MSVSRLTGGLTPPNGADPRTFPTIWNATADVIDAVDSGLDTLEGSVTALSGTVSSQGSAITVVEGSAVALGSAVSVIQAWDLDDLNDVTIGTAVSNGQVLSYSTAVSGWVNADATGGGKVLQVVSTTKTDTFSTSSTTFADLTGMSATITPSSATSKILVLVSLQADMSTDNTYGWQIVRGATAVGIGDAAGNRARATVGGSVGQDRIRASSMNLLDSPSTTSSTTYKIQIRVGTTGTVRVNSSNIDDDFSYRFRGISTITLMEVAA